MTPNRWKRDSFRLASLYRHIEVPAQKFSRWNKREQTYFFFSLDAQSCGSPYTCPPWHAKHLSALFWPMHIIHLSYVFPNLTFKPYFSSIVNDDAFLYVTKSNASNTSNYITYICMYIWHVDVNSHQYFLQISKNQFWSSKIVYVRIQRFVIMFHINIAILGAYCIFRHIQISSTASTSNFQTTSTLW